jgi:hypothetical protein
VRDRTAFVVSLTRCDRHDRHNRCDRYDVILVSSSARCPLRGRHRMPVTNT